MAFGGKGGNVTIPNEADPRRFVEPGRSVAADGRIIYAWPPEGRFVELWTRIRRAVLHEEMDDAIALLNLWRDENSTLVAYTQEDGEWVDVEPDWQQVEGWLDGPA